MPPTNTPMGLIQLGMQSAPVVYVYPATEGDRKVVNAKAPFAKYDFSKFVLHSLPRSAHVTCFLTPSHVLPATF
jgi:hypothetical protein